MATEEIEQQAFIDALVARAERQAAKLDELIGDERPDIAAIWGVDQPQREGDLAQLITGWIYRLAQIGAWDVLDAYNPDSEGWDAETMLAWLRTAAATYAHQIEQATTEAVTEAVAEPQDWQAALALALGGLATMAATHALTAATSVASFGGMDAARASGLDRKTWRTGGANPRTSHAAQNGETVDLDDIFSNGLRYPGDTGGDLDEVVNCHCGLDYS